MNVQVRRLSGSRDSGQQRSSSGPRGKRQLFTQRGNVLDHHETQGRRGDFLFHGTFQGPTCVLEDRQGRRANRSVKNHGCPLNSGYLPFVFKVERKGKSPPVGESGRVRRVLKEGKKQGPNRYPCPYRDIHGGQVFQLDSQDELRSWYAYNTG